MHNTDFIGIHIDSSIGSSNGIVVFARWSPVPEPAISSLVAIGLAYCGFLDLRRQRKTRRTTA